MLILSNPEAWEKFCEYYALGRHDMNYQYTMEQVIELVELIKKAEPVNLNANVHRGFYEIYIDALDAIGTDRKAISPLLYLKHGFEALSVRSEAKLREQLDESTTRVKALRGTRDTRLLTLFPVNSRTALISVCNLLYAATVLYGIKPTVSL